MLSEIFKPFENADLIQKAESHGCLPEEWLDVIYSEKWFKLFVPKSLGGLELGLMEGLKVEEELAHRDASLGWTLTLCAGAAWFVGFFDEQLRKEIFADPKVCLAGSGHVGGRAETVESGYKVAGHWTYASGALHATHFTANCTIFHQGKALLDTEGKEVVKAFVLKKSEVEILDGWQYMGMIATGSHAFKAEEILVPASRCFEIRPEMAQLSNSIYHYPFLQFAEATLAANILGITRHLQALLAEAFWQREQRKPHTERELDYFKKLQNKAQQKIEARRGKFYQILSSSWQELQAHGQISESRLQQVSKVCRKLTMTCRQQNAVLYPFAGLAAAQKHTELNRVWRDFNTVSQHSLLTFPF